MTTEGRSTALLYDNLVLASEDDGRSIYIEDKNDHDAVVLTCEREQHPHDSLPHSQIVDGYYLTWERL